MVAGASASAPDGSRLPGKTVRYAARGAGVIRVIAIAFEDVEPIPDGAVVFTCEIAAPENPAARTIPVTMFNVIISTPRGQKGTLEADGATELDIPVSALATPPMVPTTWTPTPPATHTPIVTQAPTGTAGPANEGRDNGASGVSGSATSSGCQTGPGGSSPAALLWLLLAAVPGLRARARFLPLDRIS